MTRPDRGTPGGVRLLAAGTGSLARGLPPAPPGTLFALSERGGIVVEPPSRLKVPFGRKRAGRARLRGPRRPGVSRHHEILRHDGRGWSIRNTGHVPIRLPGAHLPLSGHEEPVPVAYTPLFTRSGPDREHLLELRIAGSAPAGQPDAREDDTTSQPAVWQLTDRERLVAVALGKRYLRHQPFPQPSSWAQVADSLTRSRPGERWTAKRTEKVIVALRGRLSRHSVAGLTRAEVGEPIGNTVNHNLLTELLVTTTLVPPDLSLLRPPQG